MKKRVKRIWQPEELPTVAQLKEELARERERARLARTVWNTVFALVVVAAVTVLAAMLWLPVLEIYGSSMSPTLSEGNVVVSVRTQKPGRGDVIAFYFGNKLLVKRVVGMPGDRVEVLEDGTVQVNGEALNEPYVPEPAYGDCDIHYPYQVPDGQFFVMGDRRATSLDSRNSLVGCVAQDQIAGRVVLRVWPLNSFGLVRK